MKTYRESPLLLLLATASVAAACSSDSTADAAPGVQTWTVASEPDLTIGGPDEREDYVLFRVAGATRLSDGTIVVANGGSSQLKYFSADGTHMWTVGGEGDGPGEFRGIGQLLPLPGDSLMVFSFRPGFTRFGADGALLGTVPFDLRQTQLPCRIGEGGRYVLADGSVLSVFEDNFYGPACPPEPPSPWRQSALIARESFSPPGFDTLATLPGTERNSPNFRVFGGSLVLGLGSDRIYAADSRAGEILVLGFDGDTAAVLPTPFEARPVPPSARTVERREFTRPDGSVQVGNDYLYPETYPRIGRLLVSRPGDLWVMAYPEFQEPMSSYALFLTQTAVVDPAGAEWRVLTSSGEVRAEVRTPPGVFPLEIGEDYVLGVSRNELDIEQISLHRLAR